MNISSPFLSITKNLFSELVARAKFAKQQAEFQQVADSNLAKVKNELSTMEEHHKVLYFKNKITSNSIIIIFYRH